jgi:hypothetical protein
MRNQIVHPAQHTRTPAQLVRRIGTRYTAGKPLLDRFLGTIGILSFSYWAENDIIRCRIKFCIQHNKLEDQHNSLSESGQVILENASWNRSFGPIDVLLLSYRSENDIIRRRIKFCIQHNTLEHQHNSLGESGQVILRENAFYTSLWEQLASYRSVIELKMIPLDAEWNSTSSTTN